MYLSGIATSTFFIIVPSNAPTQLNNAMKTAKHRADVKAFQASQLGKDNPAKEPIVINLHKTFSMLEPTFPMDNIPLPWVDPDDPDAPVKVGKSVDSI